MFTCSPSFKAKICCHSCHYGIVSAELYWRDEKRNWWEVVVGSDYTFDNGTHVMAEYLYNGRGKTRPEDYQLSDWMTLMSGTMDQLGRHYVMIGGDRGVGDLSMVGVFGILNMTDLSYALMASWTYSLFEGIDLNCVVIHNDGPDPAEFSVGPGSAWARITAYF